MGDVVRFRNRYKRRLDSAYQDINSTFLSVMRRHRADDAIIHAMTRFLADLIVVAAERKGCGEVWRETMVEMFTKRVRKTE